MGNLLHATIKDPANSGYTWREFYCPACMKQKQATSTRLTFMKQVPVTPKYLSRMYPPVVDEPVCRGCGRLFRR